MSTICMTLFSIWTSSAEGDGIKDYSFYIPDDQFYGRSKNVKEIYIRNVCEIILSFCKQLM